MQAKDSSTAPELPRLVRARYRRSAPVSDAAREAAGGGREGRQRPRRRVRRRFLLLLSLVLALLPLSRLPGSETGRFDGERTLRLGWRVATLLAEPLPDAARELELALRPAEAAAAAGVHSAEVFDPVLGRTASGLRHLGAHLRQQRALWNELEPAAEAALRQARREAGDAALLRQEMNWLVEAEMSLRLARRLASEERWQKAHEAARRAVETSERIHRSWQGLYARYRQPDLRQQWRSWVEEAIAGSRRPGETSLVVDKLERSLTVYRGGRPVASFAVELGVRGVVRKQHAGDRATPEGRYLIVDRKTGARTRYYKALLLDYPNQEDLERWRQARRRGRTPPGRGAGGLIEIHGDGGKGRDWTDGCIALTNGDMDRLFDLLSPRTSVTIVGTGGSHDPGPAR